MTGIEHGGNDVDPLRLTGPGAGAIKYDVLTALSVAGLTGSPTFQTSMLRLIALVTARYNWARDELCVGQREMARMWAVNERTVKREMKRLTGTGVLVCARPGVRGRVGAYRLDFHVIAELSQPAWAAVGPDFEARMTERHRPAAAKVVRLEDFASPRIEPVSNAPWGRVMERLAREAPALYGSWFARLSFSGFGGGVLRLAAPGAFVQRYIETHLLALLHSASEEEFGPIDRLEISSPG